MNTAVAKSHDKFKPASAPPKEPHSKVEPLKVLMTPARASELLAYNTNNRPLNKTHTGYLSHLMQTGQWKFNGDVIRVASDGVILDGQHRLTAIVQTGIPQYTLLCTGLDRDVFTTIDAGKKRSHADHLSIAGHQGRTATLAASARIAMMFKKDGSFSSEASRKVKISPEDVVVYVEKHKGLLESMSKFDQKTRGLLPSPIAIGCHYVFGMIDMTAADDFMYAIANGEGLKEGNPALAVRNRLISYRSGNQAGSTHRRTMVQMLVHGFNNFRAGKELKIIRFYPESEIILEGLEESILSNW